MLRRREERQSRKEPSCSCIHSRNIKMNYNRGFKIGLGQFALYPIHTSRASTAGAENFSLFLYIAKSIASGDFLNFIELA